MPLLLTFREREVCDALALDAALRSGGEIDDRRAASIVPGLTSRDSRGPGHLQQILQRLASFRVLERSGPCRYKATHRLYAAATTGYVLD